MESIVIETLAPFVERWPTIAILIAILWRVERHIVRCAADLDEHRRWLERQIEARALGRSDTNTPRH